MASKMRRARSGSRGQTLTEFALILPVFLLVLVGILDLGRAAYAYNTVSNAAREGTRLAIVDQSVTGIQDLAAQKSVGLGIDPTSVQVRFLNPDLSTTAPCNQRPVLIGCVAVVTVTYQYVAATPLLGNIVGPISISATSRQAVERSH
jgi:Flp pilus assembly protein TadG